MRFSIPTLISISFLACNSETTPKTFNNNPEATITSHATGATVLEGYAVDFRAQVSDSNHSADELEVSWYVGTDLVCDWAPPTPAGESGCVTALEVGDESIVVEVRDPEGAGGRNEISLTVIPTESPTVSILSPQNGGNHYTDQLISFKATIGDAEDEATDLVSVWESSIDGELNLNVTPDANGEIEDYGYLTEGEHAIKLHVTDRSGKTTTESLVVNVGGENSEPLCEISTPTANAAFVLGQTVAFAGNATDQDINNSALSITWESDIDGVFNTTAANTDGSMAFSYDGLSAGNHSIALKVEDEAGGYCQTSVQIALGTPPSVTLNSPLNGDVYNVGDSVIFSAEIADGEDTPDQVALSWTSDIDGEISNQAATSVGTAQFTKADLSTGLHTLILTATDSDGLTADAIASFRVNNPPDLPTVSVSPATSATDDQLHCMMSATDPDADSLSEDFGWINLSTGALLGTGSSLQLDNLIASPGDIIECTATATDPYGATASNTASATVINTAPSIDAMALTPSTPSKNDTLNCEATASDIDGPTTLSFAWTNLSTGASHASTGTGPGSASLDLSTTGTQTGDEIQCQVTVTDPDGGSDVALASVLIINSAPGFDTAATISPTPAYTNSTLSCSSNASDPDDGILSPVYEWSVNGQSLATGSTYTVDANQTDVGDSLVCTATATDSDGQTATSSASATIENTLPTAALISLGPPAPAAGVDDLFCSVDLDATDIDGQPINYGFQWWINGMPNISGSTSTTVHPGDTMPAAMTTAGDTIYCVVTPNDGIDDGPSVQSNTLTIDFACANTDAFISTQTEADSYLPCTELNSISIDNTSGILSLNLPNLVTVHNTIYISNNSDLFDVNLPALESVGSYVYFYHNYDIETIDFTSLETVDGYFYIDTNTSIDSFSLPVLSYVDEYSYFSNNTLLCVPNLDWATISQDYHYDNGNMDCGSPMVFEYTGGVQTLIVPSNVYSITVDAYGAKGGDGWNQDSGGSVKGLGGLGGYASATIPVTPGETLEVYVGETGQNAYSGYPGLGGFNGGGDGTTTYNYQGGGGGGASDVRRGSGYGDRLIVAGGGGAGSGWCTAGTGNGGHGGGATGADGQMCSNYPVGTGGTQSSGGSFGSGFGYGGSATNFAGAGGGGGYYGGGASDGSGAGGGSSFVAAPGNTNQNTAGGVNSGPGEVVISW